MCCCRYHCRRLSFHRLFSMTRGYCRFQKQTILASRDDQKRIAEWLGNGLVECSSFFCRHCENFHRSSKVVGTSCSAELLLCRQLPLFVVLYQPFLLIFFIPFYFLPTLQYLRNKKSLLKTRVKASRDLRLLQVGFEIRFQKLQNSEKFPFPKELSQYVMRDSRNLPQLYTSPTKNAVLWALLGLCKIRENNKPFRITRMTYCAIC